MTKTIAVVFMVVGLLTASVVSAAEPRLVDAPQAIINSCTQATIIWQTNEPTTAVISYWKTGEAGQVFTASASELSASHTLVLTFPQHQFADAWRYQIVSKNKTGEQPGFNSTYGFTLVRCLDTTSTPAPIISNVQIAAPNCTDTAVIWQTDKRATSTLVVTNTITGDIKTLTNSYRETYHSLTFTRPYNPTAVKYTFTVSSQDENGNLVSWPSSGKKAFTTTACEPEVGLENFKIVNQSCQDLDFAWKTSIPVTGVVKIWSLANPAQIFESVVSALGLNGVVRLHTPPRSAPEEYGMQFVSTNAAGQQTHLTPLENLRMYACVPK